jgi:AcrR family transcriptional regulator
MVHTYPTSPVNDPQTAAPRPAEAAPQPAEAGAPSRAMRSDASRNHEAIVTAAIIVLGDSPQASMHEIAEASGIGRTTLYRHFPDRGSLIEAILARLIEEANAITVATLGRPGEADPLARLIQLGCEFAGFGNRYAFLQYSPQLADLQSGCKPKPSLDLGYAVDYIRGAQAVGKVRTDLDAEWLLDVFTTVITQYVQSISVRNAARGDGHQQLGLAALRATISSLFAPAAAPPGTIV